MTANEIIAKHEASWIVRQEASEMKILDAKACDNDYSSHSIIVLMHYVIKYSTIDLRR